MATTSSDGPTAAPPAPPAATPPPPASELHPNCEVLSSRAITLLFTIIRDKRTTQRDYVAASDRLMTLLAEEGLARLPAVAPATVATPCGAYAGLAGPPSHTICGVDIVRSGGILLEAVRKIAPDSKTAKILIQRDEETAEPKAWRIHSNHLGFGFGVEGLGLRSSNRGDGGSGGGRRGAPSLCVLSTPIERTSVPSLDSRGMSRDRFPTTLAMQSVSRTSRRAARTHNHR